MRLNNVKPSHYIIGALLVVFLIWIFVYNQSEDVPRSYVVNNQVEFGIIENFRECVKSGYDKSLTDKEYFGYFKNCVENLPKPGFDAFNMGRFGEKKIFLPMRDGYDQSNCVWITVGIGGDDLVEKLFKEKYPSCKLYGVEASPDQYAEFQKYGQVIPHGVGEFIKHCIRK